MTLKARVARLEGSQGEPPGTLRWSRQITCTVRQQSIKADTRAAFAAAGLVESDGDIIRQIVCQWPGQSHAIDPDFIPEVLSVEAINGAAIR